MSNETDYTDHPSALPKEATPTGGFVVQPKLDSVLHEAHRIIFGERAESYGPPEVVFKRYAKGLELILADLLPEGTTIPAERVAMFMIVLKMMREVNKHGRDNIVDIAGYTGLLARITGEG